MDPLAGSPDTRSLQTRPATVDDARRIAEVHVASWQAAYRELMSASFLAGLSVDRREAQWRAWISAGKPEVLVAHDQGLIQGWVAFDRSRDAGTPDTTGEVWAIYAHPSHWSGGVGAALWRGVQARLCARGFEQLTLWVLSGNARAQRFYRAQGLRAEPAMARTFTMGSRLLEEVRYTGSLTVGVPHPSTEASAMIAALSGDTR